MKTWLVALVFLVASALDRDRLAERDRLLALADVASFVLPAHEGRNRAWRDAALQALREREQLVAERVVVECAVRAGDRARLLDGRAEQFCKGGALIVAGHGVPPLRALAEAKRRIGSAGERMTADPFRH